MLARPGRPAQQARTQPSPDPPAQPAARVLQALSPDLPGLQAVRVLHLLFPDPRVRLEALVRLLQYRDPQGLREAQEQHQPFQALPGPPARLDPQGQQHQAMRLLGLFDKESSCQPLFLTQPPRPSRSVCRALRRPPILTTPRLTLMTMARPLLKAQAMERSTAQQM